MHRKAMGAALAVCCLTLSGCTLTQLEYQSVVPHDEQYNLDEGSDALVVDNYMGLKNAIFSFVEAGSEYGVIRIYQYENEETWDSATIEAGLAEAVDEICNTDPLGVYAVDYMTHDCTKIATYYEIHLYIIYTRTPEEIAAIIRVGGMNGIRSPMTAAIVEAEPKIALRVSNYAPTNYDLLARRCYRGAPSQIVCLPEITSSIYPVSGVQRIVELQFQYPYTDAQMDARRAELDAALGELASQYPAAFYATTLRSLCNQLRTQALGKTRTEDALLYDLMCGTTYSDESIALAVTELCDRMGVSVHTVVGEKDGREYCWNMILLGDVWYHLDTAAFVQTGEFKLSLDDDMQQYSWNTAQYPTCDGQVIQDIPEGEIGAEARSRLSQNLKIRA